MAKAKSKPIKQPDYMFSKINKHFFDRESVDQAVLILASEITAESASNIVGEILTLNFADPEDRPEVINLLITTPGGDLDAAIALIDAIRGSRIPVRTIATGRCNSAGLCILMSGHQRVATQYTALMSHQYSTGMEGNYNDLKTAAREFDNYYAKMVDIYAKFTGTAKSRIEQELLNHSDVWLTPQSAVEYGIIDLISTMD